MVTTEPIRWVVGEVGIVLWYCTWKKLDAITAPALRSFGRGKASVDNMGSGSCEVLQVTSADQVTWQSQPLRVSLDNLVALSATADRTFEDSGLPMSELIRRFADAVPFALVAALKSWAEGDRECTLLVCSERLAEERIPWEILAVALDLPNVFVARLSPDPPKSSARSTDARLLGVGWGSDADGMGESLRRELGLLSSLQRDVLTVKACPNPTTDELQRAIRELVPTLVHIVGSVQPGTRRFLMESEGGFLEAADIPALFDGAPSVLSLNTCHAGRAFASTLSRALSCSTVAWANEVSNDTAERFAAHFFRRLLNGADLVTAVRSFRERFGVALDRDAPVPTLWLRSLDAAHEAVLHQTSESRGRGSQGRQIPESALSGLGDIAATPRGSFDRGPIPIGNGTEPSSASLGGVQLQIELLPALSPALLKNGQPIFKNVTVRVAEKRRLRFEITCDAGSGTSVFRTLLDVTPEDGNIPLANVQFPVLYQLIEAGARRRYVTFSVTVSENNLVLAEQTLSCLLLGSDEWVDSRDLWPFLPAFIRSQDACLAELQSEAAGVLQDIADKSHRFDGYERGSPAGRKQVEAFYKTLAKRTLRYTTPLGGRIRVPGIAEMALQLVRSPSEILASGAGTCHDFSLLFASFAERVNLLPLVIMTSGHSFFGFWTTPAASEKYWNSMAGARVGEFGAGWLITSSESFRKLVDEVAICVIETTAIADPGPSGAFNAALGTAQTNAKDPKFQVAIDVARSRVSVQPL